MNEEKNIPNTVSNSKSRKWTNCSRKLDAQVLQFISTKVING